MNSYAPTTWPGARLPHVWSTSAKQEISTWILWTEVHDADRELREPGSGPPRKWVFFFWGGGAGPADRTHVMVRAARSRTSRDWERGAGNYDRWRMMCGRYHVQGGRSVAGRPRGECAGCLIASRAAEAPPMIDQHESGISTDANSSEV